MKIFSFDAEANGLWGKAFAISAVLFEDGVQVKSFLARCPVEGDVEEWVRENVLPAMEKIPNTHADYFSALEAFFKFYLLYKEGASVIVHMGLPVEARLFLDAHNQGFLGDWDAPYPLIDISALPEIGTSVDAYNDARGIGVGGTHNPLSDSINAAVAYERWLEERSV